MIKKKISGNTLKEQMLASAKDRLYIFVLAAGGVRGAVLRGTRMVNEMRANHGLGILETLALGHAYLGCGLMSGGLKGHDRVSLQIDCSGPKNLRPAVSEQLTGCSKVFFDPPNAMIYG